MPTIHPSAVVDPRAQLADDVVVGPFCFVAAGAVVGAGTRLIAHVTVAGGTTLGEHNTVHPGAVLGGDPQDLKYQGEHTELVVGDHNEIRECVTLHRGTVGVDGAIGVTRIGSHNLLMAYAHVAHDCEIASHTIISNAVQLAGHVRVGEHAIIAGASAVHHFTTIGAHSFVGGMTRVVIDVPPYVLVEGNPARPRRVNDVGLRRRGFGSDTITHLRDAFRRLFGRSLEGGVDRTAAALLALEDAYPHDQHVQHLVAALRQSAAGRHGRALEAFR